MADSEFLIQIVHKDNKQVIHCTWAPGLAAEKDLIEELGRRVASKGVGIGRTQAHVVEDVKQAMRELLYSLKSLV